ncbi:titin homolog isoform X13 [Lytechinus variegatus]|uniref:titin homolog isoform X13 n=1 Tax=Lytechinus variegatus TaxID=7654 RepID=UPI001BB17A0A|nr:titin homolog isoform X13 [Lytechinus variegatus]
MLSDLCRGTGVVRHGKIEVIPDGRSEGNTPTCKKTTGPARAWPQRNRPKKAQPKTGNGVFTFKQRWNLAYAGNCETAQIRPLGIPRVTSATVSVKKSKAVNDAKFSAMWSHYMSTSSESSSTPTSGESQLSSSSSVSLDDVEPWEDENEEWDYHNIQGRRFYLPPLQQHAWAKEEQVSPREVRVHKTYTTRKGALLLYAEDLALTSEEGANVKKRSMEAEDTSYFNSISDLRNAVLSYGSSMKQQSFQPAASQVNPSQEPFLGFVHNKRSHGPYKTVRPGFSAKRYLANWSRSWDDSILNYLRSEGHIWDKNLFQQNVLAPNLYRRINDDLSHVPLPYRVTRNMLMSPGEFESLEFYRIRPDSTDADGHALTLDEIYDRLWGYDDDDGYDADIDVTENGSKAKKKKPFNLPGSIAMIVRDMQQKPHAVQYEQLDEGQQRQVLQRLLLQSALHQQQHLRMIREENEKKKTETEDGEKDSADSSGKRPMPLLSGQPKQRRTDTDMTLYGSPSFQVPDAQDVDMEQAIANLITSNSTNIIGGATAFTDQTILDMYRSMRSKTMKPPAPPPSTSPSQWPHGSKRRVKNSMYHTYPSNFAGIQPLPPIQNSFEGNAGAGGDFMRPVPPPKQGTGPPVITMEPPTPQHPKLSAKSKLSVGWSSHSKTRSKSSTHSSSETNIWKADINENDLLQEAEREEIENDRASSDQELWTKSPRSSNQGSSKKASSKNSAVSKASKGSGESNVALSINSHLSHSMENLASPVEKALSFRAAGSVPTRLRESMRSYKGSGKSSHGSVLFGDSEGDLLITGSKQGSTYAPSVGSLADKDEFPSEADGDETKTVDRSVKLGQGVIDLPMSEPVESSRDKMSDTRRSVTYSKKSSSTQGSIKADSVHSGKGDLDVTQSFQNFSYTWKGKGSRRASKTSRDDDTIGELSDDEKEDNWPGQPDRSKPDSVKGEGDDQQADISSKRGGSVAGSESEVEIEVDLVDDENKDNEGEAGEDGDIKSGSGMSSLLEAPVSVAGSVRSRPRTVEAQLEQLVEAASVVVDEIMQRPKSGRDLAEDAMMAAEIWSGKLGELFTEEDTYPERVRSAPYRRRRNSLDNESDTSSMLEEKVEPYERTTPMSSRRTRKIRRIHSAEAAVTLLRHLLKASDPDTLDTLSDADLESLISRVAEENINVKIGEEVSEMIENQDNLNHQDIVVVEDISERKIIIESIASTTDYGGDTEEDEEDEIKTVSEKEFTVRSRASVMEEEAAKETIDDGVKSALAVLTPKPPASAASKASSRVPSGAPSGTPSKVSSKAPSVVVDSPKGEVTEVKAVPPAPSSAPPKAPSPQPQPQVELSIGAEPVKVPVVKEKESKRRKSSKSADSKKGDATGDGAQENGPLGFGVTNLGVAEKKDTEKSTLVVRAPPEPEKPADDSDAKLNDELAKIVQETGLLDQSSSKSKKGSMSTKTSTKSNKSSKSSKSSKSKKSKDAEEDDKDAFIVGVPKESKTDILLYKPMTPEPPKEQPKPPPKEKKKIQKKTKKPAAKQEKPKKTKKPAKDETKSPNTDKIEDEEAKLKAEKEKQEEEERKKKEEEDKAAKEAAEKNEDEAEEEEEEDEGRASPESPEFIFVQDEFSDSEEEEKPVSLPPELPVDEIKLEPSVSAAPSEDYSEMTDFTEDSTSQGPNSISRSQAKAFKRAAEAEKRKAAVEKKRREREEAKKRAQDEAERAERIKLEYEEEKRRKEAEALERAAKAAEERERLARQEEERKRQAAIAAERERRQQAEYKRKMEEMARKKREEDMKRKAEEEQRRKEEEERKRIEAEMLAAMEEAERLEFEKRRKAEELEAARIAEEERIKREIEEKIAEEKARLLAIELAKRQKEVEARLAFNKELHSEANVFAHSQDMTRAFTWSYFELLEHLGIEIPDSLKEHYKEIAESKDDG